MPSVRKIYKQGNTPVISLPPNLLRQVKCEIGSTLLIYPISDKALLFEVHHNVDDGLLTLDRVRQMRAVIVRIVYRQGNSFVCSISRFMLELIGIGIGDYLQLAPISPEAFTGTAMSREQLLYHQAQGRIPYNRDARTNPPN